MKVDTLEENSTNKTMSIKLYVGNVPTSARNSELKELFEKFGKVVECDILKEFAFVHMDTDNDAKAAIAGLNDSLWKGGRIRVELSTTKTQKGEPAKRDFNNSRGRGGFDRGRGGRGGFSDRGRGGSRGGFNDRGKGGFGDRGRGGYDSGRGGFNDRGRGRGGFNGGDGRNMSRGGFGERYGGPQRRENGGGGPMRDRGFNGGSNYGRPYPDQYATGRNGPPMHREDEFGRDGYGGRPPMQNDPYGNGHHDYYPGPSQNEMNGFNGGNGNFNGGGHPYMRPPMNQGPPMGHQGPPMNHQGPPDYYQSSIAPNGPPLPGPPGQRFNNFDNNNFNNGPPRGRYSNNY